MRPTFFRSSTRAAGGWVLLATFYDRPLIYLQNHRKFLSGDETKRGLADLRQPISRGFLHFAHSYKRWRPRLFLRALSQGYGEGHTPDRNFPRSIPMPIARDYSRPPTRARKGLLKH